MRTPLIALPLALALSGCGGSSPSPAGGSAANTIAVSSSDTTCEVARTQLDAGQHRLAVQNTGKDVTEVYVYGKGSTGRFDRVVGEVENIAPQTSREFQVSLTSGTYEVACKPGQKGDGIRTALTVSGGPGGSPAAATAPAYDREVQVTAKEFTLTGLAGFTAKVGEKIEFKLKNEGSTAHELEILAPDGSKLGEVGPTQPGQTGEVVLSLTVPGSYRYLCGLADHASKGMAGSFTVG